MDKPIRAALDRCRTAALLCRDGPYRGPTSARRRLALAANRKPTAEDLPEQTVSVCRLRSRHEPSRRSDLPQHHTGRTSLSLVLRGHAYGVSRRDEAGIGSAVVAYSDGASSQVDHLYRMRVA